MNRWDSDTSLPDGVLSVREMVAADAAASAALWRRPAQPGPDHASSALRERPVDDPLLYQLADPRRARPRLKDALWVRIIDVPARAGRGAGTPARWTWSSRCATTCCRPTPGAGG